MELVPVDSDMLQAVGWENGTLHLIYKGGKRYPYYNVPKKLFDDLLAAESKGQFVNKYIKPKYPVKK